MSRLTLVTPSGQEIPAPDIQELKFQVLEGDASFWEAGSGDAALRFYVQDAIKSEMILMLREIHGVFVQFIANDGREYVISTGADEQEMITIKQAGNPWSLPRAFFITREEAFRAIQEFCQTGEMLTTCHWVPF